MYFFHLMNKRIIIPLLLLVVLVLLGLSISGFFLHNKSTLSLSENAAMLLGDPTVEKTQGTVEVQRNGAAKDVKEHETLKKGDTVKVSENGMAVIYWQDGSLSRVKGPAEVAINELNINEQLDTQVDMTIQSGEVWTKVLDMVTEDSSFTSRTKNTVASIRGTEMFQKSSDGDEVIATYQHGVDLEVNGEKKPLMNGEEFRLEHGKETLQTRATDPASWISDAQKQDKEYLGTLSSERVQKMQALMMKHPVSFPSDEELKNLLDLTSGDIKEKNEKVQNIMDTLSLQIRIAYSSGDMETARKKADQLGKLLETYIPNIEMSDQRDSLLGEVVGRMNVQSKILFSESTPDELIALRTQLALSKLTLMGDNPEKASALMQRQLFFVEDLVRNNKKEEAKQFFTKLSEFNRVNEPEWNTMSGERKTMMQKTSAKLVEQMPELSSAASEFQKRVLSGESQTSNSTSPANTIEQVKMLMSEGKITEAKKLYAIMSLSEKQSLLKEFPELGDTVTKAENANTSVQVREEKKINTNATTSSQAVIQKKETTPTPTATPVSATTSTQTTQTTQTNAASSIEKPAIIPPKTKQTNTNTASKQTTVAPTPIKGVYTPSK